MTPLAQRQTNSERLTGLVSYEVCVPNANLWVSDANGSLHSWECRTSFLWTPEEVEARMAELRIKTLRPTLRALRCRP